MTVKRVNRGRNHSYVDADTGRRIPGVTTILGDGLPKPALINWAANATAEAAIDRWDEFAKLAPSARLKALQGARYADRDAAANRGTKVHALAEMLIAGERVTIPDGLEGHVRSYVQFLDDFDVQPVLTESLVASTEHDYCGTLDLIADLLDPDEPEQTTRWLLDIKTSRSGVFGETALQLAAYRYADFYVDGDAELELPEVDRTGVVHVRADGYDLVPVEAGELQFRQFLYVRQVADFAATARELVGEPVSAPTSYRFELTRVGAGPVDPDEEAPF